MKISNKIKPAKILLIACIFTIIPFLRLDFAFAQTNGITIKSVDDYDDNEEIKELNREIDSKKDSIRKNLDKQEELKKSIQEKRELKADLNNQLGILENRVAQNELEIAELKTEIDKINLEIKKTNLEITAAEDNIASEKDHLASVLRLMHKQDSITTLEVLLLNNSFSDYINQLKYLDDINLEVKNALDDLKADKRILEEKKNDLIEQNTALGKTKQSLEDKKKELESQLEQQTFILEQTEIAEYSLQNRLRQAKLEQERAAADIFGLERQVRDKVADLDKQLLKFNDSGFIWPVPKNIITASFHDPDYPFRYIFEHPGVDIRAGQGTPIRATASGYVARAKDGGMGYSYIMLVHGNGLSSVYGHVSQINVNEDEYVLQGQVIGKSGGLPGTPGAGGLTTGPHLHFEVRLNGIPVNPLEYLP